jgi:hypothetical protein
MLRVISELAGTGIAVLPHAAAPEPSRGHDAERRQLTMMFIDLVGSTALSAIALMMHRARDLLIRKRSMLVNALRGHLAEFGLIEAHGAQSGKTDCDCRGRDGWAYNTGQRADALAGSQAPWMENGLLTGMLEHLLFG